MDLELGNIHCKARPMSLDERFLDRPELEEQVGLVVTARRGQLRLFGLSKDTLDEQVHVAVGDPFLNVDAEASFRPRRRSARVRRCG